MSRFVSLLAPLLLAAPLFASPDLPKLEKDPDRLVVHEWGTFTSVCGTTGAPLLWRPLSGKDDLPSFVYSSDDDSGPQHASHGLRLGEICRCGAACAAKDRCQHKSCVRRTVRLETPVIYFYSQRKREVRAAVRFPKGKVTEWYPHARAVQGGIDWGRVLLDPEAKVKLPRESGPSHYYPAREVDAVPIRVCGETDQGPRTEYERFLFYRGVGSFSLPLSARYRAQGREVELANFGKRALGTLIVFEREGGRVAVRVIDTGAKGLEPRDTRRILRPLLGESSYAGCTKRGFGQVRAQLERVLVAEGLYRKEARAMVETWGDHWFEPGLRVFYLVPRARTDELLPLTLEPAPDELVRVLVGRLELITPALRQRVKALVSGLTSNKVDERVRAIKALKREGRFAEPVLIELAAEMTPAQRALLEPFLPAPGSDAQLHHAR